MSNGSEEPKKKQKDKPNNNTENDPEQINYDPDVIGQGGSIYKSDDDNKEKNEK